MLSDTQSSQSKVKLLPTLSRLCLTQCKASPEVTAQRPALLNYYSSHFSHPFPTSLLHIQIYIYIYTASLLHKSSEVLKASSVYCRHYFSLHLMSEPLSLPLTHVSLYSPFLSPQTPLKSGERSPSISLHL